MKLGSDLNRLLSTTTTPSVGDDIVVSYAYDQVGNRTRQTDGRDCIVRFTYDGLNRLLTTVHDADTALVATETNVYNDLNKVSYEDAEGRVIEYAYDVRNRLTGETVPSRTQDNRTRTYDDVGNLLSVTHAADTWRDTAQTYDELNRVVSETSSGLTHTHTYDKANNRLTTTYDKSGRVLTRTYDAGNRLLTQEDVLSGEPTRLTSFAYDPQGNLLVKTLTDSSTENRTFDVRNRVTELHVKEPDGITTRLLQTYEYDLAGNLTALEESSAVGSLPTRVLTCAYDGTHRLIVEADQRGVDPAIVTNYTYDKADNRISREVFGGPEAGTTIYTIGNGANGAGANQIASLTRPDTSVVAFTYDLTGARTSRTNDTRTDTYSYDVWTRLLTLDLQTPASPGDRGLYEYSYDARTRRVSREELSVPTVLSFQGGVSIQEYAASPGTSVGSLPSPTVEYVRGPGQGGGVGGILYSVRSGAASLAHSSARGDVVAKVDETTSTMTWQAQYEAFGRRPEEAGTNVDRQRANSKDEDPTGLLNEGFRYRDLETGTFITRDPAGFVDGPNLYAYVRQNPWTAFDPDGLELSYGEDQKVKKRTMEILTRVTAADPRLAQIVRELEVSPRKHVIVASWSSKNAEEYGGPGRSKPLAPGSVTAARPLGFEANADQTRDRFNGKGMGMKLETVYGNFEGKTPEQVMAHELGHAFDINRGITPLDASAKNLKRMEKGTILPPLSHPQENENRAVRTENIYNEAKGLPIRREYPPGEDRTQAEVYKPEGRYAPVSFLPKDAHPKKEIPSTESK